MTTHLSRSGSSWLVAVLIQHDAMPAPIDLAGQGFGKFRVVRLSPTHHPNGLHRYWECVCVDCGETVYQRAQELRRGVKFCPGCSSDAVIQYLFKDYRKGALDRDYSFDLNYEQFKTLIFQNCRYCGIEPFQSLRDGTLRTGIDRVDNKLGYVWSNVVPCCKFCNLAKQRWPVEKFQTWMSRVRGSNVGKPISLEELLTYNSRVIVAGSRKFNDYVLFCDWMDKYIVTSRYHFEVKDLVFISGDASSGADEMIIRYAVERNVPYALFPADWDQYGKRAGYIRNAEMAKHCTHLLAFWNLQSRGTMNMIGLVEKDPAKRTTIVTVRDDDEI